MMGYSSFFKMIQPTMGSTIGFAMWYCWSDDWINDRCRPDENKANHWKESEKRWILQVKETNQHDKWTIKRT
jgi:hypothetical protein